MMKRNHNQIEMSIYRKPTHTYRFITRDSCCPKSTKMAVFNSMVYIMCKLPFNINSYINEVKTIKEIANVNGYTDTEIDNLVTKHSRNIKNKSMSTFFQQTKNQRTQTRVSFNFTHSITNHLKQYLTNTKCS